MAIVKNLIGLDIGKSSIKLVKLKKIKNKIELEKAKIVEFKDEKNIQKVLSALLKSEKIRSCKIALSVSGQSVFTRFVKLPRISKSKVEQVVKYEAQQQIPFPIDKVVWSYQLFEDPKTPQIEIFLAAIKKDIITSLYERVSQVKGVDIVFIQPSPIALYNILKFNNEIKDDTIILDLGAKVTNVIITKGRQIWIRSIPTGGEDLTRVLSEKLNITLEKAEALKRKESIILVGATGDEDLTPNSDDISQAISPVLTDLLAEISRSINYYKSQFDNTSALQRVLLTGGTSKIRYIERFFENNLKIKTQKVNLLKKIITNKYLKANLDEIDNRLDVALGLGLAAIDSPVININLISNELEKIKEFGKKEIYIISSQIVTVLIFLMLSFFCSQCIKSNKENLSIIEQKMDRYRKNQAVIGKLQMGIEGIETKLNFFIKMIDDRKLFLNVLADINNIIPKNTWLTKLSSDLKENNAIIIEGKSTGSFDTVNKLRENLMKLEYFSEIDTLRADPPKKKTEEYNVIFSLKLKLKNKGALYFSEGGTVKR